MSIHEETNIAVLKIALEALRHFTVNEYDTDDLAGLIIRAEGDIEHVLSVIDTESKKALQ